MDGEPGCAPGLALDPGHAAFPGGLPIMTAEGQHIGGVGVSGATSNQDEECAQAGLDAIAHMLKLKYNDCRKSNKAQLA